ncbi:hypothetical protein ACH0AB_01100 [Moraxella sp. 179-F 1C4 NHS]
MLYHYLAAAALDIPTPTDHHAYLTYQLDVIKCEHRYYLLDLTA